MDVFKDEVYEEMDDISKLIEPFEYSINNELAQFPDEFEITADKLNQSLDNGYHEHFMQDNLENIVRRVASDMSLNVLSKEIRTNWGFVREMFEIQARTDEEGRIIYNAVTGEISGGKLFVVKRKIAVEDREIENKMAEYAYHTLSSAFNSASEVNKKNLNVIAELFGATEARQERSWRKKATKLGSHYRKLVREQKLVVKDFELFKRFINWNILYIKNGNLPAMSNITKLKIMMRSGKPIYSVKEEQV
jgi:hypothetical protein